ncbi:MAG TPA: hypothetical protein VGR48_06860 [Terriglobales bacterium]|nr:hypothetical protein [Terriglobales bacterium]
MIFGFNTDVKHQDTVYHVQSEAREHEHLLQTQVFVRGRCIGKLATPYQHGGQREDASEKQLEQGLRAQHKSVLDAIREGRLEGVLGRPEQEIPKAPGGLKLQWTNADTLRSADGLTVKMLVTEGEAPVDGAKVTARLKRPEGEPLYSQAVTDSSGTAELRLGVAEPGLSDSDILVQATHGGRVVTRKFRLRRAARA